MVNDVSYDVLAVLLSKLEAVSAYEQYIEDCQDAGDEAARQLFEQIKADDEKHIDLLRKQVENMVKQGSF